MYFQGRKVRLEGRNATQRWRGDAGAFGSDVVVLPSVELRRVRAQRRPPHSRCLPPHYRQPREQTSVTRRDKQASKQTNKKKRRTIARATRPTHTRARLLQKILARYPADIPSFPAGSPEPLLLRFHFPIALRVVVFFLSESNPGGNVKELPPSTSSP